MKYYLLIRLIIFFWLFAWGYENISFTGYYEGAYFISGLFIFLFLTFDYIFSADNRDDNE